MSGEDSCYFEAKLVKILPIVSRNCCPRKIRGLLKCLEFRGWGIACLDRKMSLPTEDLLGLSAFKSKGPKMRRNVSPENQFSGLDVRESDVDLPVAPKTNRFPHGNDDESFLCQGPSRDNTREEAVVLKRMPFNVLQTSQYDINLMQNLLFRAAFKKYVTLSTVTGKQAIHQPIPPHLLHLKNIERLNMVHQIPEIGVVVVGNQIGRVGILSMTYCKATGEHSFNIEAIVPFSSQETLGQRPEQPLMGIAVGPVQGYYEHLSEDASSMQSSNGSARRYRLLLIYLNHTILTYEIRRHAKNEEIIIL